MRRKDKRVLCRIIISAIILASLMLCSNFGLLDSLLLIGGFDPRLLLYIAPYLIIGYDILLRAVRNIFRGQVFDENFLMSIATIGALVTGEYSEAVFVMLFYQVGELFQSIAVGKSRRSIKSLLSIRSDTAFVMGDDGELFEKDCEEIEVGDIIHIKPGGKIPLDGVIISGKTSVNTVALTGESMPRDLIEGDEVISGCVNISGLIEVRVTKPFGESTVSKILKLVEESAEKKSKSEEFITKFAKYYTPIVVISALLLAITPPILLDIGSPSVWREWVMRAMTFLVISCPCALVISVPLSYFGGIGSASKKGILIKGSCYLSSLADCDTVVLDKTGTLTEGKFKVSRILCEQADENELLSIACSVEKYSTHPIAESLRAEAKARGLSYAEISSITELPGFGISGELDGKYVYAGNLRLMEEKSISVPECHKESSAGTEVFISFGEIYLGKIIISDVIKSDAKETLGLLKHLGIKKTVMLTGDRADIAKMTADELGIDEYYAELLPSDKVACFEKFCDSSKGKIAFIGDGINDSPVLSRADIGIAMGAFGSESAIESADIVLMDDKLSNIASAISLSRRTKRIVIENIVFALGVKISFLILGALGLAGLNFAVFADVGVAVIAILNSMRNLRDIKAK